VYNVLAWNTMAAALITDFAALPPAQRNVALRFFTDPRARDRYDAATAEAFAREAVSGLRSANARYPDDPGVRHLIKRVTGASSWFAELWAEHDVRVSRSNRKRIHHPVVGWLDLDCEGLHDPVRDQWVIFYTAAPDTPSHEALRLLRVVGVQDLTPALRPGSQPDRL
jgi:hypothetical protein